MFLRGAGVRRFGGALAELSAGSSVATQLLSMPDSVFANKFSATISQCQQSAIDCTPCSALGCYERSTLEKIGLDASVVVWQSCLWSAIIAVAIFCLWPMIVFENEFSAIISQTQTIYDCNRLTSLCSNLLRPFDPREVIRVEGNISQHTKST